MRSFIFAAVALTALAGPVFAQVAVSGSGSNADSTSGSNANVNVAPSGNTGFSESGANSTAGSNANVDAGGAAGATINQTYNTVPDPNANYHSTVTTDGTQTIRNNTQAPDVVTSGANACATPIGASTSVLGFGFGFGATPVDKGCERRDDAAAMHALGHDDVAMGIMCESQDVADAMTATGHQCPSAGAPVSPPVAAAQPMPTGDANTNLNNEVATTPPPAPVADYVSEHRAWCKTLNPADPREMPYIEYDCSGIQ